jgi:hypothetical protein
VVWLACDFDAVLRGLDDVFATIRLAPTFLASFFDLVVGLLAIAFIRGCLPYVRTRLGQRCSTARRTPSPTSKAPVMPSTVRRTAGLRSQSPARAITIE